MRLLMNYVFNVGTKIPYSEWPELVHKFLQKQGLSSNRFMYYFEDILDTDSSTEKYKKNLERGGCSRILKDCPELAPIRILPGEKHKRYYFAYLSNIDGENFSEEKIIPLIKRIHRRYGFAESNLYYYDIDFFQDLIPYERDLSDDEDMLLQVQPYGSGICLHRDACADNYVQLSIDLMHNGRVLDPTPYYDAMRELFPNIRVSTFMKLYLSQSENDSVETTNRMAAPILERCRDFFTERFHNNAGQSTFSSNYSIATPLKKMCKQYGYSYKRIFQNSDFSLKKRTPKGHVLYLEIISGPSRYNLGFELSLQGIGFKHSLGVCNNIPKDQETADACIKHVMKTIAEFETTLLPSLDDMFPETPNWFIPS